MSELVQATTADHLILHGLFSPGNEQKAAVIHIHGFEGDFFTNEFVTTLNNRLPKKQYAFLSVQTRGLASEHLMKSTEGKWKKYGSHFELLEEAYLDIDAWVKFFHERGYQHIVLQGHSMGTMKIVRYLFEGKLAHHIKKLILLAPFDIIQLAQDATGGKWPQYLETAQQKVADGQGETLIPPEYLDVEMSYQTYVSHHQPSDFSCMFAFHDASYRFPILNRIDIPVQVIVGSQDEFFHPAHKEKPLEAMQLLRKNLKHFSGTLLPGAGHGFEGFEDQVAEAELEFLSSSS